MKPTQVDPSTLDMATMTRELDRTKSQVFLGENSAFLGTLMTTMEFYWSRDIPTAATDGVCVWWNPEFFLSLPKDSRKTVLVHELWHPGLLHMLRRGERDPKTWNCAADHKVNLDLKKAGFSFEGIEWACMDPKYAGMVEEDIYDDLIKNQTPVPEEFGDMIESSEPSNTIQNRVVANVVRAVQQAKLTKQAGKLPGIVEKTLSKFLTPVIPWKTVLHSFFTEMLDEDYTWARPNRRFDDIYLPSRFLDDGRLEHLAYYLDVSGSVSDHDVLRFNSEVKYIKEQFNPLKLSLVQFDTQIQQERIFLEDDPFDEVVVVGRGGTCFECVRDHIIEHRPTAAIIFSDMYCDPMRSLPEDIPVIWIVVGNAHATIPFGKKINIKG